MTDDAPPRDDKPGRTLRILYIASLALLLVYFGFWIHALISPMRYRIVFDQLGMTEPPLFIQVLEVLTPVINAVSTAAPIVALLLLISGWPVLKGGSRRTMKRMLWANCSLVVIIIVFAWVLQYALLQGSPGGGS